MQDESAAASAMAFLAAGILFLAAIGVVLAYTDGQIPPDKPDRAVAGHHLEATNILGVLAKTDSATPPSLVSTTPSSTNLRLDSLKLSNFRDADCVNSSCDFYETVKLDLGLGPNLEFHVAVEPIGAADPAFTASFGPEVPGVSSGTAVEPASATVFGAGTDPDVIVTVYVFPG